jgi:hypothetical protein
MALKIYTKKLVPNYLKAQTLRLTKPLDTTCCQQHIAYHYKDNIIESQNKKKKQ